MVVSREPGKGLRQRQGCRISSLATRWGWLAISSSDVGGLSQLQYELSHLPASAGTLEATPSGFGVDMFVQVSR